MRVLNSVLFAFLFVFILQIGVSQALANNNGWDECNLSSNGSFVASYRAGCKTFKLSVDGTGGGGQIDIFVKRIVGYQSVNNQLWLIAGGPGYSGTFFESMVEDLLALVDGKFTVYLMDHRGTGRSNGINCESLDPSGNCVNEISSTDGGILPFITTQNIVFDYTQIITNIIQTDQVGERGINFFYGVDHGAFILNQLLRNSPNLVDGVIYDSFMYPSVVDYDENANSIGLNFAFLCYYNSICHDEMQFIPGNIAIEDFFDLFDKLDCPSLLNLTDTNFRKIFRNMAEDPIDRNLLLPVVARLLRCNKDDVKYLKSGIYSFDYQFGEFNSLDFSSVIRNQIILNDLYYVPNSIDQPTARELKNSSDLLYFSDYTPSFYTNLDENWPWNFPSVQNQNYFIQNSTKPTLVLTANFDLVTSPDYSKLLSSSVVSSNNSAQFSYVFPTAPHYVIGPYSSLTIKGENCGLSIVGQFLLSYINNNGTIKIDPSCINSLALPDYGATDVKTVSTSAAVFGSTDVWGSGSIPNRHQNSENSYQSSYFIGRFTSDQIPDIPNLSLNSIVMVDTLDSSQILEIGGTLSSVVTGLLPPSGFFTTQGNCAGCNSSSTLTPPSSFSICLFTLFYLIFSICFFHRL